jgi:hypothetical protein
MSLHYGRGWFDEGIALSPEELLRAHRQEGAWSARYNAGNLDGHGMYAVVTELDAASSQGADADGDYLQQDSNGLLDDDVATYAPQVHQRQMYPIWRGKFKFPSYADVRVFVGLGASVIGMVNADTPLQHHAGFQFVASRDTYWQYASGDGVDTEIVATAETPDVAAAYTVEVDLQDSPALAKLTLFDRLLRPIASQVLNTYMPGTSTALYPCIAMRARVAAVKSVYQYQAKGIHRIG